MKLSSTAPAPVAEPVLEHLAKRVQRGDDDAMRELYDIFSTGIRFMLFRQLGPDDLDDKVHEVFLIIAQSIRNGELRDPSRLMGYIHAIVRRQIAAYIDRAVSLLEIDRFSRSIISFSGSAWASQTDSQELALRVLQSIPKRDREVLIRFYFKEESPAQICQALNLTETQFRLIKSRAKARFGELGRRRLAAKANARG